MSETSSDKAAGSGTARGKKAGREEAGREEAGREKAGGIRATLAEEVRGIIAEARAALATEVAFQKARVGLAGAYAGGIATLGVVALMLVFFAAMALVLGLLLGLAALYGPWVATAAVVGGLLLLAGLAGLLALGKWRRLRALFANKAR